MQAKARISIPARIESGASIVCSASRERGIARNVTPKALTKHAAASPLVSASMPTARGIITATSALGMLQPPRSDWKTSHSDAKPACGRGPPGERAPPAQKAARRPRHAFTHPPRLSNIPRAGRARPRPAAEKGHPVEPAMMGGGKRPAKEAERRERRQAITVEDQAR